MTLITKNINAEKIKGNLDITSVSATTITGTTIFGNGSGLTNIPISGITSLQSDLNNKFDKTGGTVNGNVLVTGNVTILGTATTINTDTLLVKDNIIGVNSNYTGNTAPFFGASGIEVLRGSATTATLLWEEQYGYWTAGLTGSTKRIIVSGDSLSLLNSGHTHPISEVINLQSSLDNKFDKSGGIISGDTIFTSGLTASTISATTYNNLPVSGVQSNVGLTLNSATLSTLYNTTLDANLAMTTTVGGLTGGTTVSQLTGKTIVGLLDDILFPTSAATYTIPTISLSGPSTSTVEVGSTISISLTPSSVKNDAGIFTQLRLLRSSTVLSTYTSLVESTASDVTSQYGYSSTNNPNSGFTISSSYSESFTTPAPVGLLTTTTTTYVADGNYNSGLPKYNNKGVLDTRTPAVRSTSAPQLSANTFSSTTYTYTGIYPYFYGKSSTEPTIQTVRDAISGGTATKVLSSASSNLTITYNASTEFLWFAHFGNYTLKSQWYVAADNKGSMASDSLFDVGVLSGVTSPTNLWNNVNFYIYLGNYATTLTSIQVGNGLF